MKLSFLFGENVCTLPATAANLAREAEPSALRVLLLLSGRPALRSGENATQSIAEQLSLTEGEVLRALAFWQANGVLSVEGIDLPHAEVTRRTAIRRDDVPLLSGEALAEHLEAEEGKLRHLIDECQRTLGRFFTPSEVGKVVALSEHLGLSEEYVLLICGYCVGMGKTTVAYMERVAYNLYNEGVDDLPKLEAYLHKKELNRTLEGKLRTLFGLGSRTLTKREQTCISEWTAKSYPYELIVHAYEISVAHTENKASFPYIDKVLANWWEKGYRTLLEVEAAEAERRGIPKTGESSFDTDEFFNLALARSYDNLRKKEG